MQHNPIRFVALLLVLFNSVASAQSIDHWEALVVETDQWTYLTPTATVPATWYTQGFNDAQWLLASGGFGFGDTDDNTVISTAVTSVFVRHSFVVVDPIDVEELRLYLDFDDGFVAYLNGVEIGRNNLGVAGVPTAFDVLANQEHEAVLYQGGVPELVMVPANLLQTGNNTLAIQCHNRDAASSDISCRPFLVAGIQSSTQNYGPTPTWFVPPTNLVTHLPIIRINTNGQPIPDSPRIVVGMEIVDNGVGQMNAYNDPATDYAGLVNIEVRGSSSQGFPKKQYAFETQDTANVSLNASLLGLPSENDWILHAPYSDKTHMRNALTYDMWRRMGWYTTRTRYCEVLLNGAYQGVYILMEQIKWDNNRVDVEKLDTLDVAGDSLTGGYIIKVDKTTASGVIDWDSHIAQFDGVDNAVGYQYDYPKRTAITPEQESYIQQHIADFEDAIIGPDFQDPATGYRKFIDVNSFIDYFLIEEFTKNVDGYRLSTYFSKQRDSRGGKIQMGPAWDFNITLGNADYCGGESYQGWALDFPCGLEYLPFWWRRLNQDTTYMQQLSCRYWNYRQNELDTVRIFNWIDSTAAYLGTSMGRNFNQWPTLGTYVWPNFYIGQNYQEEVDYLKYWIGHRIAWMDSIIPQPNLSCMAVAVGDIEVSEINYNSISSIDTDDWFELHNRTGAAIDLSFWTVQDQNAFDYYTFPMGSGLGPDGYVVVARNLNNFNSIHVDTVPLAGPTTWALSNAGDALTLRDALNFPVLSFGFDDAQPWPINCDGTGRTLEFLGGSFAQSDPTAWHDGCVGGSPGGPFTPCDEIGIDELNSTSLLLYPNPASSSVRLNIQGSNSSTPLSVTTIEITDMLGRSVLNSPPAKEGSGEVLNLNSSTLNIELNVSLLPVGLYTVSATLHDGGVMHQRLVVAR